MLLPFSVRFDFLLVIILCGILGIMAQSGSSNISGADITEDPIFGADFVADEEIFGADVTEDPIFGGELISFYRSECFCRKPKL